MKPCIPCTKKRRDADGRWTSPSRATYSISVGRIPRGRIVIAECGTRGCCEPTHLRLASKAEIPSSHPWKLGDATVAAICTRWCAGEVPARIAAELNISPNVVTKYLRRFAGSANRKRKGFITSHGYARWGNHYVHRIVAEAWYGPIPAGFHVHHRDEDKLNNHPDNLEIIEGGEHHAMHAAASSPWSDHADAFLIAASGEGVPARIVAEMLGVTRNAVGSRTAHLRRHGRRIHATVGRRRSGSDGHYRDIAVALYRRSPFYREEAA